MNLLLIIDDKPDNLFVLEQVIREHIPECEVITISQPEKAFHLAKTRQPSGILSDIQMPGINGIELCRLLKNSPETDEIPVLLMTAHRSDPVLRASALEAGADDFIAKPVDNVELVARIKVMFRIKSNQDSLRHARNNLEKEVAIRTQQLRLSNEKLKKEKEKSQQYLDIAEVMLMALDKNGTITLMNPKGCTILELQVSDALGTDWFENYVPEEIRQHHRHQFNLTLSQRTPSLGEYQHEVQTTGGKRKILSFHSSLVRDAEENIEGLLVSGLDMSEKVLSEKKNNQLRLGLEALWKVTTVSNKSLEEIYDHLLDESINLTRSKFGFYGTLSKDENTMYLHSWNKDTLKDCAIEEKTIEYPISEAGIWADAVRKRKTITCNNYTAQSNTKGVPEGHVAIHRFLSVPIFSEGRISALAAVANKENDYGADDVQLLENFLNNIQILLAMKTAEEDKKHLATKLQQAQKMEAIGTLAGGIAHDFNNILSAILGYSELAKDSVEKGSETASDIDEILQAGKRAKELVNQILTFSRQTSVSPIPLKIQPIIKESIKLLRSTLPATIEITTDIRGNCGPVMADPTQINQIVMNLCTNASQAMEENGGTLTISLSEQTITEPNGAWLEELQPGKYVVLSVKDTGHGIEPEILQTIFDPYFTTKDQGKGTGLGLSIIQAIMNDYNGLITVESNPAEGTEFTAFFPRIEGWGQAEQSDDKETITGTGHILFVDDEVPITRMYGQMLVKLGYTVSPYTSSTTALEEFRKTPHSFDLVITDQTMPEMTGVQLAQKMLLIRSDIPIILCTGFSNVVDKQKAEEYGIKAMAYKPLTQYQVAQLIHDTLNAGK